MDAGSPRHGRRGRGDRPRPGHRLDDRRRARGPGPVRLRAHRRRPLQPDLPGDRRTPGNAFALRRPPVSHVLPTAHDMRREHTVISALGETGVPVPRTLGLCTDESVNGAPFYVMSFVEGHIVRDERSALQLTEASRARAGDSLIDTLAALHAVDVDAIGLGDFARRDGYIARQLKRWHGQFTQSTVDGRAGTGGHRPGPRAAGRPDPRAAGREHRARRLPAGQHGARRRPAPSRPSWTGRSARWVTRSPTSACCWSTGPSPGTATRPCSAWPPPPSPDSPDGPTCCPGTPTPPDATSSHIAYYRAFGFWKLACILQGVHVRYAGGAAAGDRSGVEQFAAHVGRLGERALAEVESL